MKQFLSFVTKEFRHIFRDRRTMLILLAMPVVQIILFGFAIRVELKDARLVVIDSDPTLWSRQLIDRLDASEYFTVKYIVGTQQEADDALQRNKADMILAFSPQLANHLYAGDAAVNLVADATDPNMATMEINYATQIIRAQVSEGASALPVGMQIKLLYNPQMKSAYNFVPGVMGLILMLICAMMTSISIVREKETGSMEVLLVSPVQPFAVILAKLVPYFVLSFVNLLTILLLSVYVLDVPVVGNLLTLTGYSLLFIFVALSLGLLISTFAQSQVTAMLVSGLVLMMPTMLLSGMIFPIESMPSILQWLSTIIPARWYISIVRRVMIQGADGLMVLKEGGILLLMALACLGVSLKKYSHRLE